MGKKKPSNTFAARVSKSGFTWKILTADGECYGIYDAKGLKRR